MYYWDGSKSIEVPNPSYLDSSGSLVPVDSIRGVPYGYRSISGLLNSSTRFYSAHRGGSAEWPEMSLYAYTQSVLLGVGMLEVSLAKTSDGVWFGLHDQDLYKTSGVRILPRNITWNELQQYKISPPPDKPSQPSRPYMRLEELLEAYGHTHIIMFDPKYELSNVGSLLTLLTSRVSLERLYGKYYCTALSFATACKNLGIKTWGYGYEADIPLMLTPQYSVWDTYGMDFGASTDAWNQLKTLGKPIIGHICKTLTDMETAISKGAIGLQVSGVTQIPPPQP